MGILDRFKESIISSDQDRAIQSGEYFDQALDKGEDILGNHRARLFGLLSQSLRDYTAEPLRTNSLDADIVRTWMTAQYAQRPNILASIVWVMNQAPYRTNYMPGFVPSEWKAIAADLLKQAYPNGLKIKAGDEELLIGDLRNDKKVTTISLDLNALVSKK